MAKVNIDKMCQACLDIVGTKYVSPGGTSKDVSSTGIDCSGLIVRAYKLQGFTIYHGSNAIWRYYLNNDAKGKLTDLSQLKRGMAVFKWKSTGMPLKYISDGLGNFHHIGLVVSTNPLQICQSSSVKGQVVIDTSIKGWTHYGELKSVDYSTENTSTKEDTTVYTLKEAYAQSLNGLPINIRKSPSKSASIIGYASSGEKVSILGDANEWTYILCDNVKGYIMDKFITDKISQNINVLYKAKVNASQGNTVNMRKTKSSGAVVITKINIGLTVDVIESGELWSRIVYNNVYGYMMSKFLKKDGE